MNIIEPRQDNYPYCAIVLEPQFLETPFLTFPFPNDPSRGPALG